MLIEVDPKDTTQLCSNCNNRVEKELSDRIHRCDNCGIILDRDLNASLNILNKGLMYLPL